MPVRRAVALLAALAATLVPCVARAWQEAHEVADEARVVIDAHGVAAEEHVLRWHIVHGPIPWVDLAGVDPRAVVDPHADATAEDGKAWEAHASRRDDGTVRIAFDEPHGPLRGRITFGVRWTLDLVAAGRLTRDGAVVRLDWSALAAADGIDNARVVFDVPAAPEAPRPIVATSGLVDDTAAAVLTRGADRDALALVRPHVPRGEAPAWTLRIDPRSFPSVLDPRARARGVPVSAREPDRVGTTLWALALSALGFAFGWLVRHKSRGFAEDCVARGARAHALVPLSDVARAWLAGTGLAGGVALEALGDTVAAAACVAAAVLCAALRAPSVTPAVRGPARWQPLDAKASVEVRSSGRALDVGSARGRAVALGLSAGVVLAALAAPHFDTGGAWWVLLDALALVPIFTTGLASQLPPDGMRASASWLSAVLRRLRPFRDLEAAPWGRLASDGAAADELRLMAMPREPMPGLVGLEVGVAWCRAPASWAASPEVLARVLDGSPAAAKLACDLPGVRAMLGRRTDERVVRLAPRSPTAADTAALVRALADALTDRRVAAPEGRAPVARAVPDRRRRAEPARRPVTAAAS
ncbi:MAG TPA: hypothetical protein VGM06_15710 [Polyangiaceae bacterium]|jgi:hypothetical protein